MNWNTLTTVALLSVTRCCRLVLRPGREINMLHAWVAGQQWCKSNIWLTKFSCCRLLITSSSPDRNKPSPTSRSVCQLHNASMKITNRVKSSRKIKTCHTRSPDLLPSAARWCGCRTTESNHSLITPTQLVSEALDSPHKLMRTRLRACSKIKRSHVCSRSSADTSGQHNTPSEYSDIFS